MNFSTKALTLAIAMAAGTSPACRAGLLNDWNVITIGDMYIKGPDTEGPVRVGGTLHAQNAFNMGSHQGGPAGYTLMVGKDLVTGQTGNPNFITTYKGGAWIGGKVNGQSVNPPVNGQYLIKADSGYDVVVGTPIAEMADDAAKLAQASATFEGMSATPTSYTIPTAQPAPLTFKVLSLDANGNAVIDIDAKDLFANNKVQLVDLDLTALGQGFQFTDGHSVIFNVSAAGLAGGQIDISTALGYGNTLKNLAANVIWNFYDASTIDFHGSNFYGAVLAPNATITNTNTFFGSVFVGAIGNSYADGLSAEVHLPFYKGFDPLSNPVVPEPSSLALAGAATVVGLAVARRRRPAA